MSKWLNKEKFEKFKNERMNDNEKPDNITFARRWKNPKMGTQSKPKEYVVRLLPDPDGEFYKKFKYHMFQSGEQWYYIMCPKTHNQDEYCPWCQITQILYQGSASDKKLASNYKRKEKFVGNVFVIKDPRDVDEQDDDKKAAGKTFLYEFPAVVEQQIKKELIDDENGWGADIFDPEEGYNMILRIGAKKPDKNGKVWPDYGQSTFSKKSASIATYTDQTVDEIMETVQSINDYINNSMWEPSQHEKLLKTEMIWEDVEEDFIKNMSITPSDDKEENIPSDDKEEETVEEETSNESSNDDPTDEELLAELENM